MPAKPRAPAKLPMTETLRVAARRYRTHLGFAYAVALPVYTLVALLGTISIRIETQRADFATIVSAVLLVPTIVFVSVLGAPFYAGILELRIHHFEHSGEKVLALHRLARRVPVLKLVAVDVLAGLAQVIGLLLFVVPGFFLAARFAIAGPLVIRESRGPISALKRSHRLIRHNTMRVLAFVVAFEVAEGALHELLHAALEPVLHNHSWLQFTSDLLANLAIAPLHAFVLVTICELLAGRADSDGPG